MEKIDKLDKQIMEIISSNARIPFKDVAAVCGVSRAAIHQRVQRLIDMNVITGSGYHISPKSLGYKTCTYVGIKLEKGSMYARVVDELKLIPEVVECHYTTGPYTMMRVTTNNSWSCLTVAYRAFMVLTLPKRSSLSIRVSRSKCPST